MKAFEWVSTIFNIFSVFIDNERGKILNIGFHIRFRCIVHLMLYDYQSFIVSLWDITVYLHLGKIQKYNIYRTNYCTFMVFIIKKRNSNTIFKVSSKTLRVKTFDSTPREWRKEYAKEFSPFQTARLHSTCYIHFRCRVLNSRLSSIQVANERTLCRFVGSHYTKISRILRCYYARCWRPRGVGNEFN